MNGIDVAVAEPPNIEGQQQQDDDPYDDRPWVHELIAEHRDKIDKIKNALLNENDPLFDYPNQHDDLWLLRFYLSHNHKTKPAIAAARETLQFRKTYQLDELGDIRHEPPQTIQHGLVHEHFSKRCPNHAMVLTLPDPHRGVVFFAQLKRVDPTVELSAECWDTAIVYCSEWTFQWTDYVTRTTGRLTKSIRIVDMQGVTLSDLRDRKPRSREAKIFRTMENCYPQLLQSIFVVNPPALLSVLGGMFRLILPKRILDKFNVISPQTEEKDRKYLLHHMSMEHLPEAYGGQNKVPPSEWKLQ